MRILLYFPGLFFFFPLFDISAQNVSARSNVLFIFVDDLRPELGCYGNSIIKTPNLDKLASRSVVFKNHYVQVPTCGASRFSLLTGLFPRSRAHLRNDAIERFISNQPEAEHPETFIHHLRRNGYYTVGIGKISHSADGLLYAYTGDPAGAKRELPHSWDELLFNAGKWATGWNAFFGYADGSNRQSLDGKVRPYENADVPDEDYVDGLTANLAVTKLAELAGKQSPFFLGVGFFKPHLPFNAPKKYWDLYDEAKLPVTHSRNLPVNSNAASFHNSGEFNSYRSGEEKPSLSSPVSDNYARKLTHAYYASVSYVDAQIGKVLETLKDTGLAENTIVVVWGDHGWHLGDHRVWGKHTLSERALKSPLIVKVPGIREGRVVRNIVSSVDIYPTLMELCKVPVSHPVDGKSFAGLFSGLDSFDHPSFSYYNNGITMRTERYRITRYFRVDEPLIELYDHQKDPEENFNVAAGHPAVIKRLMRQWENGDTGLYRE
ncbi:MAG: sulfatase [Cyclobacteriaceae bacterium]